MTMRITMLTTVMGESGSLLLSGSTYTVSDAFGLAMVGGGKARDTDGSQVTDDTREKLQPVFSPTTASYSGIVDAVNAAAAAGGGIVQLPPTTITLTATLPWRSGVSYRGVPAQTVPTTGAPDLGWNFAGGTVLVGDGTFQAIAANNAPDASSPTAARTLAAVVGSNIENIGFENFTSAIDAGADVVVYAAFGCSLKNLWIKGCTSYALRIQNFQHCTFEKIHDLGSKHGPWWAGNGGNSTICDIFSLAPNADRNSRGIQIGSTETTGWINEVYAERIQRGQFGRSTATQAATMANGVADITVTDGAQFPVGMPLWPSASVNGLTQDRVYIVRTQVGNVITIADNTASATVITSTGATAVNFSTNGYPALSILGGPRGTVGSYTGNTNSNIHIKHLDTEGSGTCAVLLDQTSGVVIEVGESMASGSVKSHLVGRGANFGGWSMVGDCVTDLDSGSRVGVPPWALMSTQRQFKVYGVFRDATNGQAGTLQLAEGGVGVMRNLFASGNYMPQFHNGMALKVTNNTSTSLNVNINTSGILAFTGGGAGTWTLPTIPTDGSQTGVVLWIINCSGSNLVVNTNGTQQYNKQAKTGYTLTPGQFLQVALAVDGATGYYAVLATNGT